MLTKQTLLWTAPLWLTAVLVVGLAGLDVFWWSPQLPNACAMTRMRPSYAEVPLTSAPPQQHQRRYRLYSYRENDPSLKTPRGRGVPVLFIPGNAGSFQQVRSLASEAARRGGLVKTNVRFDFYAADFAGEHGAFRADALAAQTVFVRAAIREILEGYVDGIGVVLVGHSMGGIVARAAAAADPKLAEHIAAIITLNTPHTRPVLGHAPDGVAFYDTLARKQRPKRQPPLISIAGGFRDTLVQSQLCDVGSTKLNATLLTAAMPDVWVEADHQCVVWCNQLVVALDKALRRIVAAARPHRAAVAKYVLAKCALYCSLSFISRLLSFPPPLSPLTTTWT